MRVHVVSDVHGAADALARAGDGADALICLGDLIHFIDYTDYSGIMADLFGTAAVEQLVGLRTEQRYDDARLFSRSLWDGVVGDRQAVIDEAVRRQYAVLFAAFPVPTYLTYGNVDLPHLYPEFARDGLTVLDGETVELGGRIFGFAGGGLQTPMRTPTELPDDVYAAKLDALGTVDVVCTHIPPALPDLTYDVVAHREERGSVALLALIERTQPQLALFGHVHQPRSARAVIGRTECHNVGHFRATGTPYVLEW
ncbi:MAG: metallophosphoesterase [Mycobacteriales bacterium]